MKYKNVLELFLKRASKYGNQTMNYFNIILPDNFFQAYIGQRPNCGSVDRVDSMLFADIELFIL